MTNFRTATKFDNMDAVKPEHLAKAGGSLRTSTRPTLIILLILHASV